MAGTRTKWPTVLGHEFVGDVVDVGPGVARWSVGDRVGGTWHGGHDGTCRQCNQGFFQGCVNQAITGVSRAGGCQCPPRPRASSPPPLASELTAGDAVAEYCNVRSEAAVRLSKDADPVQIASFLCAGLTVFNAIRHQEFRPGETVVIQGIGGLGHLGIQYARKMGYRVVAVSTGDAKRAFAMQLGAHHYINSSADDVVEQINKLGGAKLVVLTAPNRDVMGQYASCLTWQGKLLVLSRKCPPSPGHGPLLLSAAHSSQPSGT